MEDFIDNERCIIIIENVSYKELIDMSSLQINASKKVLLGAIQIPSFLTKETKDIEEIAEFAAKNALAFKNGGFDGVFIQDTTIGSLSMDVLCNLVAVTKRVKDVVGEFAVGSQMECDDAKAILAVAKAASCSMVRIKTYVGALMKNCGVFNGQGPEAYRYKLENKVDASILCDIFNLTGVPIGGLSFEQACSMALRLGATGLIVCGHGYDETLELIGRAKDANPNAVIICGGNATQDNIGEILGLCDGAIVSSCLKSKEGTGWDEDKIKRFVEHARG